MIKEYFGHIIDLTEIAAISKPRATFPGYYGIEFTVFLKGSGQLICYIITLSSERVELTTSSGAHALSGINGAIAGYGPECMCYSRIQPMIDELINDWKEAAND